MNASETLFLTRIEDHVIVASVEGSIYGLGFNEEEAIDDAVDHGFTEEELDGLVSDDCPWMNDDEEDY